MSNRAQVFSLLPLLAIGLLLVSCSEENPKPENLISEDTYIDMLVELQLLEVYRSSFPPDSVNIDSLTNIVFNEFDVTKEQFSSSHRYYQRQPTLQKNRVSQAMDTLRQQMIREGMIDSLEAEKMMR